MPISGELLPPGLPGAALDELGVAPGGGHPGHVLLPLDHRDPQDDQGSLDNHPADVNLLRSLQSLKVCNDCFNPNMAGEFITTCHFLCRD